MLTGIRDLDEKILNDLPDEDLVNACRVDTKADEICHDQMFWMNRILTRFPKVGLDILKKYKKNRSWSDYYIYDLRKINRSNAENYLERGSMDGRMDHVIIALGLGANIHRANDMAVRMASLYNHLDIVKYLVGKGADITATNNFSVRVASRQGYLEIVKYLVENGADIHADNDAAVKWAHSRKHSKVVDYLISQGAVL